ncbi:MAG: hypothetical protein ACFFA5_03565 [Promethearchaeota archaeon]
MKKQSRTQRVHELKAKIDKISLKMIERSKNLNRNVIKTRKDPEILQLWNQLCQYHMEAIAICKSMDGDRPIVCSSVLKPLGCVEIMHLSDEKTCCSRYLERVGL